MQFCSMFLRASYQDKDRSVDLLVRAYQGNLGPLLIIKRDRHIEYRLRKLMEYIFETCFHFGEVLLSKDGYVCICLLYPDKKRTTLKSIWQTARLIFQAIGLRKLPSVLRSEEIRQQIRPKRRYAYGWLIGVDPAQQGKGLGSTLMHELVDYCFANGRPLYFEAAIHENVLWYQKLGFELYHQHELGCLVSFFRKEIPQ